MNILKKTFALLLLSFFLIYIPVFAADKGSFGTTPKTNNGKKWQIAYYEGGEYSDYQKNLTALVKALMEMGWIKKEDISSLQSRPTKEIWKWLSESMKSNFMTFPADAYYSANWDDAARKKLSEEIIQRCNTQKDIDLILAMGTKAAQDIANDKHRIPTIVMSTSNPIEIGIIRSIEDSGHDHIVARVDPTRYERQIRIFHDIIGFKKLGMVYRDDATGRSYAALDKVEKISKERGFEIVSCFVQPNTSTQEQEENVKQCFQELGKKAEAIYVSSQGGVNKNSIPDLVAIANTHRIPTFSQAGSDEVKAGFLLSIALADYKYVGQFYAQTIAKIFNGAKPRQLNQQFEDPPKIAINIKTAQTIGYDPPVDVLGVADEIYHDIAGGK